LRNITTEGLELFLYVEVEGPSEILSRV